MTQPRLRPRHGRVFDKPYKYLPLEDTDLIFFFTTNIRYRLENIPTIFVKLIFGT